MEKIIPIDTNIEKFYKLYLYFIRPLLKPHLSKGEINVLGELLYLDYSMRDINPELRGKLIFDYDNRIKIVDSLDISYNTLGNIIMSLRKKDYIKGNKLREDLSFDPSKEFSLEYKFIIK